MGVSKIRPLAMGEEDTQEPLKTPNRDARESLCSKVLRSEQHWAKREAKRDQGVRESRFRQGDVES